MPYSRSVMCIALLIILSFPNSSLSKVEGSLQQAFGFWTTYFYFYSDIEKMPVFLKAMQSGDITIGDQSLAPFSTSLSFIIKMHREEALSYIRAANATDRTRDFVSVALWLAGMSDTIAELYGSIPDWADTPPPNLEKMTPRTAEHLDMMWGAFLATGRGVFIENIVKVLDEDIKLSDNSLMDSLTRKVAIWSLASNSVQHEKVRRIIYQQAAQRSGSVKRRLERILETKPDNSTLRFQERDGDFSATLLAITPEEMVKLSAPIYQTIDLDKADDVHPGDKICFLVLFNGMDLDDQYLADVEYSLSIRNPESQDAPAVFSGLTAVHARTPMRFIAFHNQAIVCADEDDTKQTGIYRISGMIHDKIGGGSIPLETTFTVREQ